MLCSRLKHGDCRFSRDGRSGRLEKGIVAEQREIRHLFLVAEDFDVLFLMVWVVMVFLVAM